MDRRRLSEVLARWGFALIVVAVLATYVKLNWGAMAEPGQRLLASLGLA